MGPSFRPARRVPARVVLIASFVLAAVLGHLPATANPPDTTTTAAPRPSGWPSGGGTAATTVPTTEPAGATTTATTAAAPVTTPPTTAPVDTTPATTTSTAVPPTTAAPATTAPPTTAAPTTTTGPTTTAAPTTTTPTTTTSTTTSTTTTTSSTTTTTTTVPVRPGPVTLPAGRLAASQPSAPGSAPTVSGVTATAATHGSLSLEGGNVTYAPDAGYVGPISFDYLICDEAALIAATDGSCSSRTVQMGVTRDGVVVEDLHPSPVDPTLPTSLFASTAFLYTGDDPVQRGVAPGTIERRRAAVVRGTVTDPDGRPVEGVRVTVRDHPEFGHTLTRASGNYDLVVNAGGRLLLSFERDGWSRAHRGVDAAWGEYAWAPAVILTSDQGAHASADPAVRLLEGAGPAATTSGPARRPTALTPEGGTVQLTGPGGQARPVRPSSLRAASYAPDRGDHASLPALPPGEAGPAHALEVWVPDGPRPGGQGRRFDRPVTFLVVDAAGGRAGQRLPLRSYDWQRAAWVTADATGTAVLIVDVDGGAARVDADGDGDSDSRDTALLAAAGVTPDELRQMASLHRPGTTVWHLRLPHPGTWAWWADAPAGAAPAAGPARPGPAAPPETPPEPERRPVEGTPLTLVRPAGDAAGRTLSVPVTGSATPAGIDRIEVTVTVAGSRHVARLGPGPDQTHQFVWDGLDGYGRAVQGSFPARVEVAYEGAGGRRVRPAGTVVLRSMDGAGHGLAGWTIDAHRVLDADRQRLYGAETAGRALRAPGLRPHLVGDAGGRVEDVAAGPDGSLYVAEANQVRRFGPDGSAVVVAGSGRWGLAGDGGPAGEAAFRGTRAVALGPAGELYVLDRWNGRVRRVGPDGTVSTVAGGGGGVGPAGGPATDAWLDDPRDLAVAADGSVYVADAGDRVVRIGTDGWLEPVAVRGRAVAASPSGGVLVSATGPDRVVRIGADGSVDEVASGVAATALVAGRDGIYLVDSEGLRRIGPSGEVSTLATPPPAPAAEGDPSGRLVEWRSVAVAPDGAVHLATEQGIVTWGTGGAERDGSGEIRVASASGPEVYAFDPVGRHLRTLDAGTGETRLEFGYDPGGRLSEVALAGAGPVRVERDANGAALALVAPGGERTEIGARAVRVLASDPVLGIPAAVLKAYRDASVAARARYDCSVRWTVLAAIGKTESGHGTSGGARVNARGDVAPAIIGIPLDGRIGTALITDTDGGSFDRDTVYDRAVGPMQFIPSTWRSVGVDGNGDGLADPHNIFDAALSAARYLCRTATNLDQRDQLARAAFSYNHSSAYVAKVLADVDFYDSFDGALPASAVVSAGGYALPVDRSFVDRDPGMLDRAHHDYPAVDLAVPSGARIYAAAGGTVVEVTSGGRCGNGVIIDAFDGHRYTYCHATRVVVPRGASVAAGQVVMLAGSTGNSSGPHLHLQIARPDGTLLCPQPLIRAWYLGAAVGPGSAPTRGCTS